MDQFIFQQIKNELINGSVKKGHPFKYFALCTISEGKPIQRTVVLRKVMPNLDLVFYTDKRSQKVSQISRNKEVSLLFYHHKKMMQVQVQGKAHVSENPEMLRKIWTSIPAKSRRDYTSLHPPGAKTDTPDEQEYLSENNFFCMVQIRPTRIEYLKLGQPNHIRVEYVKKNDDWKGTYLVP